LHDYLLNVGRLAAEGIDGDIHQELYADPEYDSSQVWPEGMADERYWEISQWLYIVHQSNPHAYLYTYVSPEPGVIEFVVSHGAMLEPVEGAAFGHLYTPSPPSVILEGLTKETLSLNIIKDEWGTWASGFTPIYNSKNEIVAAVGVDYKADEIIIIQDNFIAAAIPAFILSYLALILAAIIFANRMINPIISISKAAKEMGEGKLSLVKQSPRFAQDEISDLIEVFNSMAGMVGDREKKLIELTEELRIFHQATIDGQEKEKTALALNIHDDLLNQLTVFSMNNPQGTPEIQEQVDIFTDRIRQIITSLRPIMLNYGLWLALEEYVEELSNRLEITTNVILDIAHSDIRYDPKIEEHIYRIVQQACENALRHAHGDSIRIYGKLEPDMIKITVEDNGIGIKMTKLDFNSILKSKSFGLAGMYERAALIDANLVITSTPGQGTRISIFK
jgi:signal transduction histidine kinase